jgi:tripartite-type tricarboxylate transporter receptor subunit TctC
MAQNWPSKPIRIIVPFPAGGGGDQLARLLQPKLTEELGQPIIIDNKPGAGGGIGTAEAARAAPDGYTFVLGNLGTHAINAAVYNNLGYDPQKDFAPVSHVANVAYFVVVNPAVAASTLPELVALAKAKPRALNFGSGGKGTVPHFGGELFMLVTGTELVHVPYKGGAPMMQGFLGGDTQVIVGDLPTLVAQVKSGKARALVMTNQKRSSLLPDVPTSAEAGYPDLVMYSWQALFAPAGTPDAIVVRMNEAVAKALVQPDVQQRLATLGFEAVGGAPAALRSLVAVEVPKWTDVARRAGIKPE